MKINNLKKPGLFAAGVLFGTAGIKILTSKEMCIRDRFLIIFPSSSESVIFMIITPALK